MEDATLSVMVAVILFSVLTNLFFNPWAAAILPSQEVFPSGVGLVLGWFLACATHFAAWKYVIKKSYTTLRTGLLWSASAMAVIWLLLIVIMCIIAYA